MAEIEAYQRAQATLLVADMADRMHASPSKLQQRRRDHRPAQYVHGEPTAGLRHRAPLGTGDNQPTDCSGQAVGAARDECEWSNALKGAAETNASSGQGWRHDRRARLYRAGAGTRPLGRHLHSRESTGSVPSGRDSTPRSHRASRAARDRTAATRACDASSRRAFPSGCRCANDAQAPTVRFHARRADGFRHAGAAW